MVDAILSNSIVTRPLSDTRTLRHYHHYLPDGLLQIGSRSAINALGAEYPKHLKLLEKGLYHKFPEIGGINLDCSWWGRVDVSQDMMPRIYQPGPRQ